MPGGFSSCSGIVSGTRAAAAFHSAVLTLKHVRRNGDACIFKRFSRFFNRVCLRRVGTSAVLVRDPQDISCESKVFRKNFGVIDSENPLIL